MILSALSSLLSLVLCVLPAYAGGAVVCLLLGRRNRRLAALDRLGRAGEAVSP